MCSFSACFRRLLISFSEKELYIWWCILTINSSRFSTFHSLIETWAPVKHQWVCPFPYQRPLMTAARGCPKGAGMHLSLKGGTTKRGITPLCILCVNQRPFSDICLRSYSWHEWPLLLVHSGHNNRDVFLVLPTSNAIKIMRWSQNSPGALGQSVFIFYAGKKEGCLLHKGSVAFRRNLGTSVLAGGLGGHCKPPKARLR